MVKSVDFLYIRLKVQAAIQQYFVEICSNYQIQSAILFVILSVIRWRKCVIHDALNVTSLNSNLIMIYGIIRNYGNVGLNGC